MLKYQIDNEILYQPIKEVKIYTWDTLILIIFIKVEETSSPSPSIYFYI